MFAPLYGVASAGGVDRRFAAKWRPGLPKDGLAGALRTMMSTRIRPDVEQIFHHRKVI